MKFQLFRRFTQHHEIDEISKLLELQNVRFKILRPDSQLGSSFGNTNQDIFELYIRQKDFALVKQILEKRAEAIVQSISEDYYLFTFKDSELQDILSNPDDWNELDVMLSSKILNERGSSSKVQKTASLNTSGEEHGKKSIPFEKKDSLSYQIKYYAVLIATVLIGILFTLYVKAYHPEVTNTHIAIIIAALIAIAVFYYESKHTCPRCKERFKTERLYRLRQGDILMPQPYNVLERYKCHNCGNVWDEFSEESVGD